eukprot:13028226-Alexandrium_andersonii.AAC.1
MDFLYLHDIRGEKWCIMSLVDDGTTFHVTWPMAETLSSDAIWRALEAAWLLPFGPPAELVVDQERGAVGHGFTERC